MQLFKYITILLLTSNMSFAAYNADTVHEIRATGATTNGGSYSATVSGGTGTDYSQQNAAQYTLTGGSSAGAGDTILHASAANDMKGNGIYVSAGTNTTVGFYQIIAVTAGVSIQLDSNVTTGVGSGIAFKVGGAFAFGGSNEDAFFEKAVAGNTFHIKNGTHTQGAAISISAAGTAASKIKVSGYNSSRNDLPSIASGNQPVLAAAGNTLTFGNHWELNNITVTTTSATGLTVGSNAKVSYIKVTNSSGTANRTALGVGSTSSIVLASDISSTNGYGIVSPNANVHTLIGNSIHDSVSCVRPSAAFSGNLIIIQNIIRGCSTAGIDLSVGAFTGQALIMSNTLYGASTPAGIGLSFAASSGGLNFISNIVSNWTTGVSGAGTITAEYSLNNNFHGNTTARTNWSTGTGDIALDPTFTNAATGNFATGTNMQRVGGISSTSASGLTATYFDIGAVQSDQSGWFTDPDLTKLLSTYSLKYNTIGANNRTGTYVVTNATDVRSGTTFGPSSSLTGSLSAGGGGFICRRR